ncbi:hypothetical protein GCM10020219_021280 [Nonomuraea dietziae]
MKLRIIAAGAALALGLTACGSADTTGPTATGGGSGDIKIGMSVSTLNNPYFVQLRAGAEEEAKKLGVSLTVTDAQNDASQQVNQVQNFTSQNMKAIVINPVDSDAAAPAVKAAERSNIPVIAADRGVNGAEVKQTVASDNVQGGKLAAEELAKQMGEKGRVVVLQGVAGTSASRDRGQGFTEGIKAYPGIQVVASQPADFDRTKGLDVHDQPPAVAPRRHRRLRRERRDGARRDQGSRRQGGLGGEGRRLRRHPRRAQGRPGGHPRRDRRPAAQGPRPAGHRRSGEGRQGREHPADGGPCR